MGGHGPAEERRIVTATGVGGRQLGRMLLLVLLGHGGAGMLGGDPEREPGDGVLEGSAPWVGPGGECWIGGSQVVVEGSLA